MTTSARRLAAILVLTAWIGAALLTIAVVAPGAFASLPSRGLAGLVIGRVLAARMIAEEDRKASINVGRFNRRPARTE